MAFQVEPRQEFGVGVGFSMIIALLVALFCFRRQKKQSTARAIQGLETTDPLGRRS
jgi:hypothetical protein